MKFSPFLQQATLVKRYKRFLADVILPTGEEITIHCPNTGSMKNCLEPGAPVWFSESDNPKRKYPFTWEVATTPSGALAGIHSAKANSLIVEAINSGVIAQLQGYETLDKEVKYGQERSRIDILLRSPNETCYVEVKSLTMECGGGLGAFPDAVSTRGTKHIRELITVKKAGNRAVLLFCVQHTGIDRVTVAADIDPDYAEAIQEAILSGVEILAYGASISHCEIKVDRELPFELPS